MKGICTFRKGEVITVTKEIPLGENYKLLVDDEVFFVKVSSEDGKITIETGVSQHDCPIDSFRHGRKIKIKNIERNLDSKGTRVLRTYLEYNGDGYGYGINSLLRKYYQNGGVMTLVTRINKLDGVLNTGTRIGGIPSYNIEEGKVLRQEFNCGDMYNLLMEEIDKKGELIFE